MFGVSNQRVLVVCGDLNIDLLNSNKDKSTDEFIDTRFSTSLFPLITKPSR